MGMSMKARPARVQCPLHTCLAEEVTQELLILLPALPSDKSRLAEFRSDLRGRAQEVPGACSLILWVAKINPNNPPSPTPCQSLT